MPASQHTSASTHEKRKPSQRVGRANNKQGPRVLGSSELRLGGAGEGDETVVGPTTAAALPAPWLDSAPTSLSSRPTDLLNKAEPLLSRSPSANQVKKRKCLQQTRSPSLRTLLFLRTPRIGSKLAWNCGHEGAHLLPTEPRNQATTRQHSVPLCNLKNGALAGQKKI